MARQSLHTKPRSGLILLGFVIGAALALAFAHGAGLALIAALAVTVGTTSVVVVWCARWCTRRLAEHERAAQAEHSRLTTLVDVRTAELHSSREQYRLIAENVNALPFTYIPGADRFSSIGPQAERMLEYPPAAWLAPGFLSTLVAPGDRDAFAAKLTAHARGELEHDLAVTTASGVTRHVRIVASAGEADGEPCVRGLIFDVTRRRQVEAEVAQAQKLESVGRLAAGVAHEINTPIQFVSDSLYFVRGAVTDLMAVLDAHVAIRHAMVTDAAGEAARAAVDQAARVAEDADLAYLLEHLPKAFDRMADGLGRVSTIVQSMKEFAHPDQAEMAIVDLNQAIRSTLTIARNEYKYVADLQTDLAALPPVQCHLGDINQAVLNIVINAAHAIGEVVAATTVRGRIAVRTRLDGDTVEIAIADTGPGIPEEIRDRVFDPFFTTKDVGRGTGQGLAIARTVVIDKHGGTLHFETASGVGTTFFIRFPIAPSATESYRDPV